jgi:hypothetical protein
MNNAINALVLYKLHVNKITFAQLIITPTF